MLKIEPIAAFSDNYIWLLHNASGAWVVDPGDATVVIDVIERMEQPLLGILITHHHFDHTGGVEELVARYQCRVVGPANQAIKGVQTRLQSAIKINEVAEPFIRRRAMRHLEKGRVVIFGGGTGNPYFTTDTAAVLRAIEINADAILKGTRVDGIYTADPEKDKDAIKFENITFKEVMEKGLKVMDMTAFTLSEENKFKNFLFTIRCLMILKKITLKT